jgi:predicted MFS family arabinose efflux permease
MLASCVSVPIAAHLSESCERKNVILSLILMLGLGSLAGDNAKDMAMFLAGRGAQGLGAGGLVAMTYTIYGDMVGRSKQKFLVAICCFTAAGTAGGPFIGATISDSGNWVRSYNLRMQLADLRTSAGPFELMHAPVFH